MNKEFIANSYLRNATSGKPLFGTVIGTALKPSSVTVGTSSVKLPTTPLSGRTSIIIRNWSGGNTVYIGDSTVSTSNGFPLRPNEYDTFTIEDGIDIYAVASGAGSDIRILEGA